MATLSKRSLSNLAGVHPFLVTALVMAIRDTPQDFTIVNGLRTDEEQAALYAKGRTLPGSIVTNADGIKVKSNHQAKADGYGYAVNFYPYTGQTVDVNAALPLFEEIARHVQRHAAELGFRVDWGGDWKTFKDAPHLELKL